MKQNNKICIVIPCYKVKKEIFSVLNKINYEIINKVYVVDDYCPEKTGNYVENYENSKVNIIYCKSNLGVGGATIKGFQKALDEKNDIIFKIDGDGQHNPEEIYKFLKKFENQSINYCKGSRFINSVDKAKIPFLRRFGNIILTNISKLTCKNNTITDVVNGFLGIRSSLLKKINLNKISKDFFFEEDLLFNICLFENYIEEVEIETFYNDNNKSNLNPFKTIIPFIFKHLKNYIIRLRYDFGKK